MYQLDVKDSFLRIIYYQHYFKTELYFKMSFVAFFGQRIVFIIRLIQENGMDGMRVISIHHI